MREGASATALCTSGHRVIPQQPIANICTPMEANITDIPATQRHSIKTCSLLAESTFMPSGSS